jgi:N-acetylglutamate synthase-like GNAT family acetyltransferase
MNTEQMLVAGATDLVIETKRRVELRTPTLDDVDAMTSLIGAWAVQGLTLARTPEDVAANLEDFIVAESDGIIIACAALELVEPSLGEIRSVSVSSAVLGTGAGRLVVEGLLRRAESLGLDEVVLLTKTPAFFAKVGFVSVTPEELPGAYMRGSIIAKGRSLVGRTAMSFQVASVALESAAERA